MSRLAVSPLPKVDGLVGIVGVIVTFLILAGVFAAGASIGGFALPIPSKEITEILPDGTSTIHVFTAPRWPFIFGIPSILLGIIYLAAATRLQAKSRQLSEKHPPENRIDLISTFTELGYRARNVSAGHQNDEFIKKLRSQIKSGEPDFYVSNQTKDAQIRYREAALETEKQINIAGGELGRVLWIHQEQIRLRLTVDRLDAEGDEPNDVQPPSYTESVQKAIDAVNLGNGRETTKP